MHRTCRAGRNVWQQLASGARSSIELGTRAAGTRSTTRHQLRSFASGAVSSADAAAPDSGKKKNNSDSNGDSNSNSNSPQAEKRIIFSAIQPTGVPHLGNYLGALREWKRLQDGAGPGTTLLFSIVDLHAITVPRPSEQLRQHRREMLAALLAVGLDPDRCALFFQSGVPEVAELQWILSCTASTGYLSRMTQWKSKMQLGADASLEHAEARRALKHGLFSYPVLQAADILVHRATHVPVGEDQRQHLEFARECVTNFNHTYRTDLLVEPQTLIAPTRKIMSLTNPTQKMSKSDPSARSRILLTDPPEAIRRKVGQAVTDSVDSVACDPAGRPGVANLLEMLSGVDGAGRSAARLGGAAPADGGLAGERNAALKAAVADALCAELGPVRERYLDLVGRDDYLREVSGEGLARARRSAGETMRLVREAVGLV